MISTIRQARDDRERLNRVAGVLVSPCPACGTRGALSCSAVPGLGGYLLDRKRGLAVHGARIGHAVKTRTASPEDVAAQFPDGIPADVWTELRTCTTTK